jgi:putative transposase
MSPIEYPTRRFTRNTRSALRRYSLRLREYDYRKPGVYFFTICVQDHRCVFAKIVNKKMVLYPAGRIVWQCWRDLPRPFRSIQLDQFVVMPNHVHGVIILHRKPNGRAGLRPAPTAGGDGGPRLANLIGALKSFSARQINKMRGTPGIKVWQRNYFERVVRSGEELSAIQQYIYENPARWAWDRENSSSLADADSFCAKPDLTILRFHRNRNSL